MTAKTGTGIFSTGKIKYNIEKVGFQKKLAERAYQKMRVEWAEKKYLDIKEESNLTFSAEAADAKTCEPGVVFFCRRAYDILT